MKALICGSGAIGIAIGASLIDSGVETTFFAKGKTKDAILNGGIKRIGLFKEITIPKENVQVFDKYNTINDSFDYIIISSKTTSNEDIALNLDKNRNLLKDNGKIVIFQNGWHTDKEFLKYFTKEQVYSARIITGFERPERNISKITVHADPVFIGSLYGFSEDAVKPLAEAIDKSGIPCETTMEVSKALWAKMLYNCTLNPLGAVLRVNYGKLADCENSKFIMNNIIDEIFKVMEASNNKSYWNNADEYKKDFYEKLVPSTYDHRASTLQDIERKIKTEIDTLTGSIIELGNKYNIDTPYNKMMYNLIKSIESNF
ncbi:ketopantoate reductase family protein [Clostridium sp. HCP1S3_B4]|uniref:ketopantoate reductase family protein n=1 Tax=unclassified Clostridium TaxID=2614128 RepID=UPI0016A60BED|nr:2-dehydropantoate 2-reductase [Clostridiales bacterium]MDY2729037.1 2-dehydropantoate 2-reductase [Clostridium sp.]NLK22459.1 2-dehydropantoate 2-reductase [Clostridiales bacterium]